ncbi:hypothetical protein BDV27DRAFT_127083 [Aspergillus caelatus]|uniref:Uncharacterized protein n=1 Tax=Aspergillus caelatus TaxID=61420 RepID=A0A5N7A6G5_9EURO|nr:uncharacterized protein BDV27DRAFT_127083 [Aspergillus caelatus]KAE8365305.1 hypothetical protein BDV27DRAFT_127083 [Aspergillus caelatus]
MALESLPTELRILIIQQLPDVQSLKSLVHASPIYYNTYALSKKKLLHDILQRQYGLVDLAEPMAALRSQGLHADVPANRNEIVTLLDRRRRQGELPVSENAPADMEECLQLSHFYRQLEYLLNVYCSQASCPPGVSQETWEQNRPINPSNTEKARILRALCRLQTYCNIFGAREWSEEQHHTTDVSSPSQSRFFKRRSSSWYRNFNLHEMWSMIFGTMPPWEVEEFGCLWVFLQQQYTEIFSEIAQEFPRNSHEWQSLRPTVDGMELFPSVDGDGSDGNDYNDYRNHLVSLGPSFLYKVLRQPSYEARRNLIACNAVSSKSSFMILVQVSRDPPSLLYPADKYESEDIGRTLPLMPAIEQPNSGWKHHWHGYGPIHRVREVVRTDNLQEPWIERTIGNSAGWQWGYAIWDEERSAAGHRL